MLILITPNLVSFPEQKCLFTKVLYFGEFHSSRCFCTPQTKGKSWKLIKYRNKKPPNPIQASNSQDKKQNPTILALANYALSVIHLAASRSILLTTTMTFFCISNALRRTKRVWGIGPSTASTSSSTPEGSSAHWHNAAVVAMHDISSFQVIFPVRSFHPSQVDN